MKLCIPYKTVPFFLISWLFCVASLQAQNSDISVNNAYVTALIPGQEVSAGYMTISNQGDTDQELVSFNSSAARMVQLHTTSMAADGMMNMSMLEGVVIPAGGSIQLQPGGNHLMIMGVDREAFSGESIDVQIELSGGEILELSLPIKQRDH